MKKLTKEQRDHILNLMENKSIGLTLSAERGREGAYIRYDDIELLLDKCTEKEFPKFETKTEHDGFIEITQLQRADLIDVCVNYKGVSGAIVCSALRFDQFKQFTEGCNKIVEWIDEQEE